MADDGPAAERLVMYGRVSDAQPLEWAEVRRQLVAAGTYWIVPQADHVPHPRPVWGVWVDDRLHLSIGSPAIVRQIDRASAVAVHLDGSNDVVIVEGVVTGTTDDAGLVGAYDAKYEWRYSVDEYGPLTTIEPAVVLAWSSAGWAGRDGFRRAGRWRFPP